MFDGLKPRKDRQPPKGKLPLEGIVQTVMGSMHDSQIKLVRGVSQSSSKFIKRHLAYRAVLSGMV